MKVAFLTHEDPQSRRSWSGIFYFMLRALQRHCDEVIALGPAGEEWWFTFKVIRRLTRIVLRKNIDYSHTEILSRILGRTFRRKLSKFSDVDLIFAPVASTEIAFLDTSLPIVLYGDLTARLFQNYAANVTGLSPWSLAQLDLIEGAALRRASHIAYASEWAANSAINDYQIPAGKVSVIPMGANLEEIPTREMVDTARIRSRNNECKLIFIGVDWERKGGKIALAAMRELRGRGINATLTVIGCVPPETSAESNMQVIPFLDKGILSQQRQLRQLLLEADFMLFPTRREAFGVVCCEANACGLPLIAANAGGVPVRNGENGILLSLEASGQDYADTIQALLNDPQRYSQLAHGGRQAFESRLNWDAWGQSMAEVFRHVLGEKQKPSSRSQVFNKQEVVADSKY